MPRTIFAVIALAFILPLTVQAQQWNAEQQEVWADHEVCDNATEIEAFMACFHEDFIGWDTGVGVPANKADFRAWRTRGFEVWEQVWRHNKPVSIYVRGDVAIVLYVAYVVGRNKVTGEETSSTTNYTDIMVKEGASWLWIGGHGTSVGGN
jgi:ketosteroid isomerase-like protein